MKIRTKSDVIDALDGDLIWRKKELTQFKFLLDEGRLRTDRRDALIRAGVTLLYAHWEGYVKSAAATYLEFVAFQRLPYTALARNFIALGARPLLRRAGMSNRAALYIEVAKFFQEGLADRSHLSGKDQIGTQGNLSSAVLGEILTTLGLDYGPFETKQVLLDEGLLQPRNTIAHGEYLLVTPDRWDELHSEVLSLMESVRTAISNAVVLNRYRVGSDAC